MMKKILFLLVALAVFSCKQNTGADVKTPPSHEVAALTGDLNVTTDIEEVTFKTEEATQIHAAYLELKGALVNTDELEAAEVASDFGQMLDGQSESDIAISLKKDLTLISVSDDTSDQRVAFEDISKKVEVYLSGEIATGTIYKQYCPMAFQGKGAYWLSNSQEIRNPYFGDKMLKCGVVDKEIQ